LTLWRDMKAASAEQLNREFQAEHLKRYGYARASLPVHLVNLRARIVQKSSAQLRTPVPAGDGARETSDIRLGGRLLAATFMQRASLRPGNTIGGPAILEE